MQQVAILQHIAFENPGSITDWLKKKNYNYTITELFNNQPLPDIKSFDWLIIMGGPMGTVDTDKYSWLQAEKELMQQAITADKKILGICLGSQLLAEVLGAKVFRCQEKEIGWWPVTIQGTGRNIFQSETLDVFQWHGDTFDLPADAERIASSTGCLNQAFIWGKRAIGLQFHLEIKADIIEALLVAGKDELVSSKFIQSTDTIRAKTKDLASYHEQMNRVLAFLDRDSVRRQNQEQ